MNKKQLNYVKDMEHYGNYKDPETDEIIVQMCRFCNGKNQGYMVKNPLWNKVMNAHGGTGMVCLGCFEEKLGRPLVISDFTEVPINYGCFGFDCEVYCKLADK